MIAILAVMTRQPRFELCGQGIKMFDGSMSAEENQWSSHANTAISLTLRTGSRSRSQLHENVDDPFFDARFLAPHLIVPVYLA